MGIYLNYASANDSRHYYYHLLPIRAKYEDRTALCGAATRMASGRIKMDQYWEADHQMNPTQNPLNKSLTEIFGNSLCQECLDKVKSSC